MWIFLVGIVGACMGSFLSATSDRFARGVSSWYGRSACSACHALIRARDLIPILSYLNLKGKCRSCQMVIPKKEFWTEVVCAVLFILAWLHYAIPGTAAFSISETMAGVLIARDAFFICVLVLLFLVDLQTGLIPDRFTIPSIVIIALFNLFLGMSPQALIVGALTLGGFFGLQYIVSGGRWVGGGDIRFGVLLGTMFGTAQGLLVLEIAYILGAIVAVSLLLTGRAKRFSAIPFGPFLAVGGYLSLLFGSPLLHYFFFWTFS